MVSRKVPGYSLCFLLLLHAQSWSANSEQVPTYSRCLPEELNNSSLLWRADLWTNQYSIPAIHNGRIFLATNDVGLKHHTLKGSGGGLVTCLNAKTTSMIWQLVIPRFVKEDHPPYFFDQWRCGVCSRPIIDGDRLYVVGSRGDILCLDTSGLHNGNDGSFQDEAKYISEGKLPDLKLAPTDGDIIWRFDMLSEAAVYPHDVCGSTVLIVGDLLYACTSNGVDATHAKATNPQAPSLIVLDKHTGRLVAKDDEKIGQRLYHCLWSSPASGVVDGKAIIFFGGGDGILYAFEPPTYSPGSTDVQTLRKLWQYDCNPPDYRFRDGKPLRYSGFQDKYPDGPSEIVATPVFYRDRVYVAIGQSPIDGPGKGMLSCIDAHTAKPIWTSKLVDRTLSTAAIADDLLYVCDFSGNLHCFDANTGHRYWVHELGSNVWSASPFVADGKVYIGTENRDFWILAAAKDKTVLSKAAVDSMPLTITAADGVLYLPTQRYLYAYRCPQPSPTAQ